MFTISKRVVCPKCRSQVGTRQVEYKGEQASPWTGNDDLVADFICSRCRKKLEEDLAKRAAGRNIR